MVQNPAQLFPGAQNLAKADPTQREESKGPRGVDVWAPRNAKQRHAPDKREIHEHPLAESFLTGSRAFLHRAMITTM